MDDEKPDIEEVFGKVLEIEFDMEFYMKDGAMDGLSTEKAKEELAEHMKNHFGQLNPFENPETTTTIEFQKAIVCENEKTHEVDETDDACHPKEENSSSSGSTGSEIIQWKKVEKSTIGVVNNFGGTGGEFVQWSSRQTQKLEKNLLQAGVNLLTPVVESCTAAGEVAEKLLSKMVMREPFPRAISPLFAASGSSFELHKWMAHLSPKMRKVPFTMLAIPGTHQSATHTMQRDQLMSFDSPLYADNEAKPSLSFMTLETLVSWSRCVKHDINQQLEMGIRYFDFRLKITTYFSF